MEQTSTPCWPHMGRESTPLSCPFGDVTGPVCEGMLQAFSVSPQIVNPCIIKVLKVASECLLISLS